MMMKKWGLVFWMLCLTGIVSAQRIQSSCQVPAEDSIHIYRTAAEFSIQREIELGTRDSMNAFFSPITMDTFVRMLAAVRNVKGIPEADTINNLGGFGTFWYNIFNEITLVADPKLDWMIELEQGNMPVSYPELNAFLSLYQFTPKSYLKFSPNQATVSFNGPYYSMSAIRLHLESFPQIDYAYFGKIPHYYKENTSYLIDNNHVDITFVQAWNQDYRTYVPINYRHFKFRVYQDCSVEFLESFGDEIVDKVLYPTGIQTNHSQIILYTLDSTVNLYAMNLPVKFGNMDVTVSNSDSTVAIYINNQVIPVGLGSMFFTFKNKYGHTAKCAVSVKDSTLSPINLSTGTFNLENPLLSAFTEEAKTLVFPNPCHSYLYVENEPGFVRYTIYDQLGRIRQAASLPINNILDIRTLEAGSYILSLQRTNGECTQLKIIRE